MKYTLATTLFFVLVTGTAFAQELKELRIGDRTVSYDSFVMLDENGDSIPDKWSYTDADDQLVASAYDVSGDENTDLWLVYESGSLVFEAHDTDADKVADLFFEIGTEERVVEISGVTADTLKRGDAIEAFIPDTVEGQQTIDEIVGDLSDIDALYTKGGFNYVLPVAVVLIVVIIGIATFIRRKTASRETY